MERELGFNFQRYMPNLAFQYRASFKMTHFAQSLCQAQILILKNIQYIPVVKIFAFLELEQN